MNRDPTYYIFAGEASGDLHGSRVMASITENSPTVKFHGVGGPKMRQEGLHNALQMEDFEVMGFSAVICALPKLIRQFHIVRDEILQLNPEVVILIDYPGFNLRLAKSLRKHHYTGKIVHYICPSVWAHGNGRIQGMVETLDLLLVIYPFEVECFSHTTLPVKYIGNPLQETIRHHIYQKNKLCDYGIPTDDPHLIALFPGSRVSEIQRNLPLQLAAAKLYLKQNPHAHFAVSCARDKSVELIQKLVGDATFPTNKISCIPASLTYELMQACRSALAKSGTVTLELALHQKPTVVVYQLSTLNWIIAKYVLRLKLPYYCIVNILAKKEVFPELIEKSNTAEAICEQLQHISIEGQARTACVNNCHTISSLLYQEDSSSQAALAIHDLLRT